ncbi:MAG: nucleotidyl transferase AbiEii/AbiGii toxin family protein [bacterium]
MNQLFPDTLPPSTARLLEQIQSSKPSFLQNFYLSGGTALSLQLGHRESEDLDFFSSVDFDPIVLQNELSVLGPLTNTTLGNSTLNCYIRGVKVQFLGYPYPLLSDFVPYDSILLSSVLDVALTKLQTIGMRGSKKDFIDLYAILKTYKLNDLLDYLPDKYPNIDYNLPHILKSLVYFEDADHEPMPRMHQNIDWEEAKSSITLVVKKLDLTKTG